jgi:hypothetical protein
VTILQGHACEVSLPARCSHGIRTCLDRLTRCRHSLDAVFGLTADRSSPLVARKRSTQNRALIGDRTIMKTLLLLVLSTAGSDRTGHRMRPRTRRHGRNHPGLRPVRRQCFMGGCLHHSAPHGRRKNRRWQDDNARRRLRPLCALYAFTRLAAGPLAAAGSGSILGRWLSARPI